MPILLGFFLIVSIGLGIVYFQQRQAQRALDAQITQLRGVISSRVVISAELEARYEEAGQAVPTELATEDVVLAVNSIAEANGFDVSFTSKEVTISSAGTRKERIQGTDYQVMLFNMTIVGEYGKVVDAILDLDSMPTLKTMAIEGLNIEIGQYETKAQLSFGVYSLKR